MCRSYSNELLRVILANDRFTSALFPRREAQYTDASLLPAQTFPPIGMFVGGRTAQPPIAIQ